MPPGPTAPDLKDVSHREALYFAKDVSAVERAVTSAGGAGVRERVGKAKLLRDIYDENPTRQGREAIVALRPVSGENITPKDMADTLSRFGAENTKPNGRGGTEFDPSKITDVSQKRLMESSFNEAKKVEEQIKGFLIYSDIVEEHERTGIAESTILANRKYKPGEMPEGINPTDYTTLQDQSINFFVSHPSFRRMFPELDTATPDERRVVIENTLMKDPRFRQLVVRSVQALRQEARNLPQMEQEEDYKKAEEAQEAAKKKIADIEQRLQAKIGNSLDAVLGTGTPPKYVLDKEVADKLDKGIPHDEVVKQVYEEYYEKVLADPNERVYVEASQAYKYAYDKAVALKQQRVSQPGALPATTLADLNTDIANAKADFDAHKATTVVGSGKTYAQMQPVILQISDVSNKLASAEPTIKGFAQARDEQRTAEMILTSKGSKARRSQKEMLDDRMQAESELVGRMQDILPNAVVDLMLERHDMITQAQKEALDKKATEEEKNGNKEVAAMIRKVQENSKKKRIHYDETDRKKIKDESVMKEVATDMQYAIYHGEPDDQGRNEGIKRLVLRDMALSGNDANGNAIIWKTTHFEDLTEEQQKMFDEVYSKTADKYRDKLFADFFMSRGRVDRLGIGRLSLKEHEMELIEKYYGDYISNAINGSPEAKAFIEKYKQEGGSIDNKTKLTLFILALLGLIGGGAMFVAGAPVLAPILGVSAATGIAAKAFGASAVIAGGTGVASTAVGYVAKEG